MSEFTGKDLAPYWRFRPTPFYDGTFLNGTYTADIQGCNWTCEHCWSKYGWHGVSNDERPRKGGGGVFTAAQVADKLIAGMKRNAMPFCRLSGGEVSMYWDPHVVAVIREVITRTADLRMHVEGATGPYGDTMGILLETNGSVIGVPQLRALEEEFEHDAERIVIGLGVKATSAEGLARLTGMSPQTCERFHRNQMDLLQWLALKSTKLGWFANFLDAFTDPQEFARLERRLERAKPGEASRRLGVDPFRTGYNASRYYTPRRFRTEGEHFNEPGAEIDEEIIMTSEQRDLPMAPQPAHDPAVEPPPHVEAMRELQEATADLPEGRMA